MISISKWVTKIQKDELLDQCDTEHECGDRDWNLTFRTPSLVLCLLSAGKTEGVGAMKKVCSLM